jgi:hypothetical protein
MKVMDMAGIEQPSHGVIVHVHQSIPPEGQDTRIDMLNDSLEVVVLFLFFDTGMLKFTDHVVQRFAQLVEACSHPSSMKLAEKSVYLIEWKNMLSLRLVCPT